jgi:hypothetical protein
VRVDRNLVRPTSHEVSMNIERELREGLSGRASYVYKNMRNVWGEIDVARVNAYTVPFTFVDPGVDRVAGTADDQTFNTMALQSGVGTDRVFTNTDDDADFQTVEVAVNRRFADKWMMLSSFGYTWSTMYHVNTAGNASRPPITTTTYRPVDRLFGDNGIETSTTWNYKLIGRYVLPYEVGLSGSWKVQSGFNYARTMSVNLPVEGARTVRVEPITANRYPTVPILDIRFDKSFATGSFGRATLQLDLFNITNKGTVTTVRVTNTATAPFNEVTAILNPRVVRAGIRFAF